MSEKADTPFQKARDEALRVLARGGLTPAQVSTLKLNEVHLATGTLVMEPDEFDTSASAGERSASLKLDAEMQRALIAWLVVRPDGPNDHLFPGEGTAGLDVGSIEQVVAPKKPAEAPKAPEPVDTGTPKEKPEKLPESISLGPPGLRKEEVPPTPPPPVTPQREEPEAVPLDEIELMRQRLADSYDAWGPAVTAATARRVVQPPPREGVPPSPPVEAEPPAEAVDAGLPTEPAPEKVSVPPPQPEPEPSEPPPREPEETGEPSEEVPVPVPVPVPAGGLGVRLRGWWNSSGDQVAFNLSYRAVALGGLALVLVVCCVGFAVAGGTMMGFGPTGLVAGVTPTGTQTPTQTALPATSTMTPVPTLTVAPTSTATPGVTPTEAPGPTSTQAPTSTPVVIVVTATATPEPPATDTPVPTDTPEGGVPPEPTVTETPGFKYPAPALIWPEDGSLAPGIINILQWEPVGTLADDEWYATRLIFRQQGQLVYEGDRVKIPEWRVPDRLYYAADGPDLEYTWYVFVERDNADGSVTQLSPDSETWVFTWK